MSRKPSLSSIENDAAIAQALAREEQEKNDENLARGLERDEMSRTNTNRTSNFDLMNNNIERYPGQRRSNNHEAPRYPSEEITLSRPSQPPPLHPPSAVASPIPPIPLTTTGTGVTHNLCMAPCVIGNVCVEMMVDTGAQLSVISVSLARRLDLANRIDRRHQGVAAGVGRARIVGQIRDVVCEIGQVEFALNFMVLDVSDQLLLLGLDLMREYKCIVDLETNRLVFGGQGGVSVDLLPPSETHMTLRNELMGCPMM